MDIFRKGLRRFVHVLGEKRLISSYHTMTWLHMIEMVKIPRMHPPKDFNEKIIWMEFNTDTTQWSNLADKYEVRKYIKNKGLENILIPLIGIFNSFDEINFSDLPGSFVIKTTNACEQIIIVKDKSKIKEEEIRKKISQWMKTPFGYKTGEVHYQKILPRIIIEELLPTKEGRSITDYKFYCFNGKVESCLVLTERNYVNKKYKVNFVNPYTWEDIPDFIKDKVRGDFNAIEKPKNIDKMIEVASILSKGFPFVRIDLYEVDGRVYFGEMTFTPAGGRAYYLTKNASEQLGNFLKI